APWAQAGTADRLNTANAPPLAAKRHRSLSNLKARTPCRQGRHGAGPDGIRSHTSQDRRWKQNVAANLRPDVGDALAAEDQSRSSQFRTISNHICLFAGFLQT
ncbi:hypothetical protein L6Q21_10295, partial [Sandaracinobacter sp. RS1-74]|uniref:hypothetical protein n=1 Tax=Sandaracinobacteroides sayramensis TaxID=2913411 RepID=UPI001EDB9E5D